MSTQVLPVLLFVAVAGVLLSVILLKVGKLRGSPQLAFASEQVVEFERGGSYALWVTAGGRGFRARLLAEISPKIALIDSSTGGEIAITYPALPVMIRGFGTYRQFATFAIERPGRYIFRIIGPATQRPEAAAAHLILERRRG
jgi:hypothetical protein